MIFTYKIAEAIIIARQIHADVNHKYGDKPYFESHVMQVLRIAMKYIYLIPEDIQERVILAILFHDVLEDCRKTPNDLIPIIGEPATRTVFAVTNNTGWTRSDRADAAYYQKIRDDIWALFVKLADRLANVINSFNDRHKMFNGYRNEHPHFKSELYDASVELGLQPMWDELDILFQGSI